MYLFTPETAFIAVALLTGCVYVVSQNGWLAGALG